VKFRVKENLGHTAAKRKNSYKTCSKGHKYYKRSGNQLCPICGKENKPTQGFLSLLSTPAFRALNNEGITTIKKLAKFTEKEILNLHGIGKTTIPILITELEKNNLSFRKEK
jgi:hypothetical protein